MELKNLWRYLESAYTIRTFRKSCPTDQEIVQFWTEYPQVPRLPLGTRKKYSIKTEPMYTREVPDEVKTQSQPQSPEPQPEPVSEPNLLPEPESQPEVFEEPANTEEEPLPPPPPPPPAEDTLPPPPPEAELPVENLAIDDAIDIPPPTSPTTSKVADQSTVSDMKDEDKDSGTEEQPESVKSNESDIEISNNNDSNRPKLDNEADSRPNSDISTTLSATEAS